MPFEPLWPPPHLGVWKFIKIRLKIGTEIAPFSDTAFRAIWTPPEAIWPRFGTSMGSILDPPARSAILAEIEPALLREHDF